MSGSSDVSGAYLARPQIALRPVRGAWQARADMPWEWKPHTLEDKPTPVDLALSTLHTAPVASTALVGACDGACRIALANGNADPEHIQRLSAIADACEGCSWHELAGMYGEEEATAATNIVGSFFGSIMRAVTAPVRAVTHLPGIRNIMPLAKFIPGIGPAIDAGTHLIDSMGRALPHPGPAAMAAAPTVPLPPHMDPHAGIVPPGSAALDHSGGGMHFHCVPFG